MMAAAVTPAERTAAGEVAAAVAWVVSAKAKVAISATAKGVWEGSAAKGVWEGSAAGLVEKVAWVGVGVVEPVLSGEEWVVGLEEKEALAAAVLDQAADVVGLAVVVLVAEAEPEDSAGDAVEEVDDDTHLPSSHPSHRLPGSCPAPGICPDRRADRDPGTVSGGLPLQ
jgi:hypothetical protein